MSTGSTTKFLRVHFASFLTQSLPNEIWKEIIDYAATDTQTLLSLTYIKPFQPHAHRVLYHTLKLNLSVDLHQCDRRISLLYRTLSERPMLGEYVRAIQMLRDSIEQDGRLRWSRLSEHSSGGYLGEQMTSPLSKEDRFERDAVPRVPLDSMGITAEDDIEMHKTPEQDSNCIPLELHWPNYSLKEEDMITQWERNVSWHDPDHTETIHLPGILRLAPNVQVVELGHLPICRIFPDWGKFKHPLRSALVEVLRGKRLKIVHMSGLLNIPSFVFAATPAMVVRTCNLASVAQRGTARTVKSLTRGDTPPLRWLALGNIGSSDQPPFLKMIAHRKVGRIDLSPTSPETFKALNDACIALQDSMTRLAVDVRYLASTAIEDGWKPSKQGRLDLGCLHQLETLQLNFTDWKIGIENNAVTKMASDSWWWWAIDALRSALHRPGHGSLRDIVLSIDYRNMMYLEHLMNWDDRIWVALQKVLVDQVKSGVKRVRVCLQSATFYPMLEFPEGQRSRILLEVQKRLESVGGLEVCHHKNIVYCLDYESVSN
ncbi:hypothetical protein FA15DRAFT_707169 [Coprinopsis marcescibilis]|uniref:Uncharacterized protein n=1 Tax=Coprinopsis marcescibilis TaxID=230819 RepID=A0A5C3KM85_COPMA|nr:hypothetical protein FA15DRAFT_707169 [Coprinopsis marcescibilis]